MSICTAVYRVLQTLQHSCPVLVSQQLAWATATLNTPTPSGPGLQLECGTALTILNLMEHSGTAAHSVHVCKHPAMFTQRPQAELAAQVLLLCCLQVLDDSTFATLSSLMLFNSVDILQGLLKDPRFFPELFRRLSTVKAGVRISSSQRNTRLAHLSCRDALLLLMEAGSSGLTGRRSGLKACCSFCPMTLAWCNLPDSPCSAQCGGISTRTSHAQLEATLIPGPKFLIISICPGCSFQCLH